jgi:hypothetical protein
MRINKIILTALMLIILSCAQNNSQYFKPDSALNKLKEAPQENKVSIIIFRAKDELGLNEDWPVSLDDSDLISLSNGSFYVWETTPGKHKIDTYEENNTYGIKPASITIDTNAGKKYYINHSLKSRVKLFLELKKVTERFALKRINIEKGLKK